MTRFTKTFVLVAVLFAFMAVMPAQAAAPVSIAVVDVQKLLTESKAGKNIQEQLEKQKTKFLTDVTDQEKKLREEEKTLTEQRASLPAEEFAKKAKEFEGQLTEKRRVAQDHKKALEEAASKSLLKLRDEIMKVVQSISDEKGYTLVVNRQNVVISDKSLDITEEALAKLDKNISAIALEIRDK